MTSSLRALFLVFAMALPGLPAQAQLERSPSTPICGLRNCKYYFVNIGKSQIGRMLSQAKQRINENDSEILKTGVATADYSEGSISYWFGEGSPLNTLMGQILMELDHLLPENTLNAPHIILQTTMGVIESKGLSDLSFGMGITYSPLEILTPSTRVSTQNNSNGGSGIGISLGNLSTFKLNLKLDAARTKFLHKIQDAHTIQLFNGEDLGDADVTPVFLKDLSLAGQIVKSELGLRINGNVQVSGGSRPKVVIQNFSITYGMPAEPSTQAGVLNMVRQQTTLPRRIELSPGTSQMIALSTFTADKSSLEKGILNYSNGKDAIEIKTFFVLTALIDSTGVPDQELPLNKDLNNNPHLSATDEQNLPSVGERSIQDIMQSVRAFTERDIGSQFTKAAFIRVDEKLLSQENFSKMVIIRTKNIRSGFDLTTSNAGTNVIRLDQLALGKYFLPPVDFVRDCLTDSANHCAVIDYMVSMETVSTDKSGQPLAKHTFGLRFYPFNDVNNQIEKIDLPGDAVATPEKKTSGFFPWKRNKGSNP